jgi:hypothetical protein
MISWFCGSLRAMSSAFELVQQMSESALTSAGELT